MTSKISSSAETLCLYFRWKHCGEVGEALKWWGHCAAMDVAYIQTYALELLLLTANRHPEAHWYIGMTALLGILSCDAAQFACMNAGDMISCKYFFSTQDICHARLLTVIRKCGKLCRQAFSFLCSPCHWWELWVERDWKAKESVGPNPSKCKATTA